MATAQKIINRALRIANVLDASAATPAQDSIDALETLNALLAEMHAAEIGLPDYEFATLGTEVASDAADREALAYQLAVRLAPEYGVQLSALVAAAAGESMSRLRLRYFQPGKTNFSELPSAQQGSTFTDIVNGNI